MKALLVQPPIYDTQYYAEWSMPSGLLKVATWLRGLGYDLRLLDCLFPDRAGLVGQRIRSVVQVCSTLEWKLDDYRAAVKERHGRATTALPPHQRYKFEFGLSLAQMRTHLETKYLSVAKEDRWVPDEVWITSIMTYWWESTRDTILLMKELFPKAKVRVGGIYPTLAPHHLKSALLATGQQFDVVRGRDLHVENSRGRTCVRNGDCIVTGEIPDASNADLDFGCYGDMTLRLEGASRLPTYAILTTSRGCPFDCSYCAQKAYNEGSLKVRIRSAEDTFKEIRSKYQLGVHHIAFYEDNFLLEKPNIERLLRRLVEAKPEMPHLKLYAPEGVEVRLL